MLSVQTISIVIASTSVVMGVTNHAVQSRNANKARRTQLSFTMMEYTISDEWTRKRRQIDRMKWSDCDDFVRKYWWAADPEAPTTIIQVFNFYEIVGALVKSRAMDVELLEDIWGGIIRGHWEKFRPIWLRMRAERGQYEYYILTEYLYRLLKGNEPVLRGTFPYRRIVLRAPTGEQG